MSESSKSQPTRRQVFPLSLFDRRPAARFAADGRIVPNRCIYKCGAACFHDAPNEQRAEHAFEEVVRRRFGRRSLLKGLAASAPLVLSATPQGARCSATPRRSRHDAPRPPCRAPGLASRRSR
jgi:hypothetical protein